MAQTTSTGGAVTLIALVTMGIFTIWFGNFMIRTVDILYKPKVKQWIRTRPLDLEDPVPTKQEIDDDKYMRLIEEELKVLKALRGKRKKDKPVQPPELPVPPPESPVQPPELPVQPPELPVQPPELPVQPPDSAVQPPDLPEQPPELPAQSSEFPLHRPDELQVAEDLTPEPQIQSDDALKNPVPEHPHQDSKHESPYIKEKEMDSLERDSLAHNSEPDIKIQNSNLNQEPQRIETPSKSFPSGTDYVKLAHSEPKLVQTGFHSEPEYDVCPSNLESPVVENDLDHYCPSKPDN